MRFYPSLIVTLLTVCSLYGQTVGNPVLIGDSAVIGTTEINQALNYDWTGNHEVIPSTSISATFPTTPNWDTAFRFRPIPPVSLIGTQYTAVAIGLDVDDGALNVAHYGLISDVRGGTTGTSGSVAGGWFNVANEVAGSSVFVTGADFYVDNNQANDAIHSYKIRGSNYLCDGTGKCSTGIAFFQGNSSWEENIHASGWNTYGLHVTTPVIAATGYAGIYLEGVPALFSGMTAPATPPASTSYFFAKTGTPDLICSLMDDATEACIGDASDLFIGTVPDARLASTVTLDAEIDTFNELNAIVADATLSRSLFHATDCTALLTGIEGDTCWEEDADTIYACEPSAGLCDTAGEWKVITAAATEINDLEATVPTTIVDNEVFVGTGAGTGTFIPLNATGVVSFNGTAFAQGASTGLTDSANIVLTNQANTFGAFAQNFSSSTVTLPTSQTLTTPTISATGFTNAQHAHAAANSGGQIAITDTTGLLLAAQLETDLRDFYINFILETPATGDSGALQVQVPDACTLQEVSCNVRAATSATVDLFERARATPNTGTTGMLTTPLACTTTGATTTSFTDSALAKDVPLALGITAVSGTPGFVRVHVRCRR